MAADIDLPRELGWPALRSRALYLDVDGTLLDLADTPDRVGAPAGLVAVLDAVGTRLGGALALVSGRPVEDLDRLFAPLRLAAVGVHGAQVRPADGPLRAADAFGQRLDRVREALAGRLAQWPGALVEDKGLALAVHYRNAPASEDAIRGAMQRLASLAGPKFALLHGKHVFELKPAALNKGSGIALLREAAPFAGRLPICIGDDVTDEAAFAYANAAHGTSIVVGDVARSAAQFRVEAPGTVRAWLTSLAQEA